MAKEKKITELQFHNRFSPNFREIHVDGAFGGITPRGYINLNLFAERFPIPKSSTYRLEDNLLGEKIADSPDSKKGVVREYEVGIYLDINTARDIYNFLGERIKDLESKPKNDASNFG